MENIKVQSVGRKA